ncbi:hypothetical protein [Nocardioides humilatus]|nr:hypothetical protein [Nocardioides humilatus]
MNVWSSNRFQLALTCGAALWELPDAPLVEPQAAEIELDVVAEAEQG